jgi:hypothetical protein
MDYHLRKVVAYREVIAHDGGPTAEEPLVKVVVAVVMKNPFAGRYVEDIAALTEPSASLGRMMAAEAIALLAGRPAESYGKGGIAGSAGEQEHVVACITTPFGDAMRAAAGGGNAWVSSATKSGGPGASLDLPLAHKDALYIRSHYDAVTITVADAPRADELLIALAFATGGRIHQRVGGLRKEDALMDGVH